MRVKDLLDLLAAESPQKKIVETTRTLKKKIFKPYSNLPPPSLITSCSVPDELFS